jgi:hypothetical protein
MPDASFVQLVVSMEPTPPSPHPHLPSLLPSFLSDTLSSPHLDGGSTLAMDHDLQLITEAFHVVELLEELQNYES